MSAANYVEDGRAHVAEPFMGYGLREGVDGRWYPKWTAGMTALLVPPYALGRALDGPYDPPAVLRRDSRAAVVLVRSAEGAAGLLASLLSPLATVATALLVAEAAAAAIGGPGAARGGAAAALLYVATTIAGPNAKFLQPETVATAALAALWGPSLARRTDRRAEILALLGAAAATAIRLEASLFVAVCAVHRAAVLGPRRALAPAVGAGVGLGIAVLHNGVRFGTLSETGYGAEASRFTYPLLAGLAGLLVSPGKGLLVLSPLLLLLPAALVALERRGRRADALLPLLALAPYLLLGRWWHYEIGMWGMRFQFYLVPLYLALVLVAYPRLGRLGVALAAAGAAVQFLGLLADPSGYFAFAQPWWVRPWYPPRHPLVFQAGAALAGHLDRGHLLVRASPPLYALLMAAAWGAGIAAAARLRAALRAA